MLLKCVQGDSYVLPLLWRGTSVKMSCPVSQSQSEAVDPPSVCCSPYSMTIKVQGPFAAELSVNGEQGNLNVAFCISIRSSDILILFQTLLMFPPPSLFSQQSEENGPRWRCWLSSVATFCTDKTQTSLSLHRSLHAASQSR